MISTYPASASIAVSDGVVSEVHTILVHVWGLILVHLIRRGGIHDTLSSVNSEVIFVLVVVRGCVGVVEREAHVAKRD